MMQDMEVRFAMRLMGHSAAAIEGAAAPVNVAVMAVQPNWIAWRDIRREMSSAKRAELANRIARGFRRQR